MLPCARPQSIFAIKSHAEPPSSYFMLGRSALNDRRTVDALLRSRRTASAADVSAES